MKSKKYDIVSLVLSALLSLGVTTVFRACAAAEDGMWMHCHTVQLYVLRIGVALAALAAAALFIKNYRAGVVLRAVSAVLALIAMLLPGTLMDMCMMNTMRCQSVMKPFVIVMGLLILASLIAGIVAGRSKAKG